MVNASPLVQAIFSMKAEFVLPVTQDVLLVLAPIIMIVDHAILLSFFTGILVMILVLNIL
jgi:hypothetical protein